MAWWLVVVYFLVAGAAQFERETCVEIEESSVVLPDHRKNIFESTLYIQYKSGLRVSELGVLFRPMDYIYRQYLLIFGTENPQIEPVHSCVFEINKFLPRKLAIDDYSLTDWVNWMTAVISISIVSNAWITTIDIPFNAHVRASVSKRSNRRQDGNDSCKMHVARTRISILSTIPEEVDRYGWGFIVVKWGVKGIVETDERGGVLITDWLAHW